MQVECSECHAHYQVKVELAGHLVKCRQCGSTFRVPHHVKAAGPEIKPAPAPAPAHSPVPAQIAIPAPNPAPNPAHSPAPAPAPAHAPGPVAATAGGSPTSPADTRAGVPASSEGVEGVDGAEEAEAPEPSLAGYEQLANGVEQRPKDPPAIPLPASVSEVWVPLAVAFLCYAITICLAVEGVAGCTNPPSGAIMLALLAVAYLVVVMPFASYIARSTCQNLKVERPGSIVLQNAAICSLPLLGMTIGLLASGRPVAGPVWGGLIGGALLFLLVPCLWQTSASKSAQATVLILTSFGAGSAGSILVILMLLSLVLPPLEMSMPWEPPLPDSDDPATWAVVRTPTTERATTRRTARSRPRQRPAVLAPNRSTPARPSPAQPAPLTQPGPVGDKGGI